MDSTDIDNYTERQPEALHYAPDEDDFREVLDAAERWLNTAASSIFQHLEEQSRALHSPGHKDALIARYKELEVIAADPKTSGFDLAEALITSLRKQQALKGR